MSVHKNQAEFQNTALLLVDIQILIVFYKMTLPEKDTFDFGTSLTGN
jgi:hypothetical protein